jgi:lipid A 3-O-deacylase
MKLFVKALAAGLACWAGAGAADAKVLEGAVVGALIHSVPAADIKNSHKESGGDIQLEAQFKRPGFLDWTYIHPYVIASINVIGDTSYVGFGWNWDFRFGKNDEWGFQPILGYVLHNGYTQDPYPKSDPRYGPYFNEHLLLGSKDLFRLGLAGSRKFGDKLEGQVVLEHLSHGYILGDEVNQGVDNLGLRLIYKFDQ